MSSQILDKKLKDYDADSNETDIESGEKKRPSWDNKFQYIMAALGFAVGLGNIWRFPYLCKKNGGGAFLIPYFLMLVIEGYPLYYLELAVGQRIRKGTIGVWSHINPYLGGVGFASNMISLIIGLYYNMILGWAGFYFISSFQSPLPWKQCPTIDNITVPECANSSPTEYFWFRETLDISDTIEINTLNWKMVVALLVAWLFVFIGMNKGIKSSGKVMYFATSFPYIVLTAFFIRAMTLEGAIEGVSYMFSPDPKQLMNVEAWKDAATQIFFSLGLGYGTIIAYSSYNPPKNNCRKDAVFIATANCLTSLFACITVFAILGFKAKNKVLDCSATLWPGFWDNFTAGNSIDVDITWNQVSKDGFPVDFKLTNEAEQGFEAWKHHQNCTIEYELSADVQGTGLAFIAFAEAVLNFPAAPFWSLLFFFMLLNIGLSSEFGILQTVITTALDSGTKIAKWKITGAMSLGMFFFSLLFAQRSGNYFLTIFDSYAATLSLAMICFMEVISVSYVYGLKRFKKDLEDMEGNQPGWYWTITWAFICPVALATIIIATFINLCTSELNYSWAPLNTDKLTAKIAYPGWAIFLIIVLIMAAIVCIPIFAVLYHFRVYDTRKLGGVKDTNEVPVTESQIPLTETS